MQLMQLAVDVSTIPQPPTGDEMPKTAETVFNIFIVLPLVGMLGFAIRLIVKRRQPGPALLHHRWRVRGHAWSRSSTCSAWST